MEENQNNNFDKSLMDYLASKGQITINNNHLDDSIHLNIIQPPENQYNNGFFGRLNRYVDISKTLIPAIKTVGKIAAITSTFWVPKVGKLITDNNSTSKLEYKLTGQIKIGSYKVASEKDLSHEYREITKKESKNGKYELFMETDKYQPLTNYFIFYYKNTKNLHIGLTLTFSEKNIFTRKFLPYLRRDDIIIYYTEKFLDNDKIEKSITYKLEKPLDKNQLLNITIYSFNQTQMVEEINEDRIEIIEKK